MPRLRARYRRTQLARQRELRRALDSWNKAPDKGLKINSIYNKRKEI